MNLELPQDRNANVVEVKGADVAGDSEASRGEVPNNHSIALNILLTVCIGRLPLAK